MQRSTDRCACQSDQRPSSCPSVHGTNNYLVVCVVHVERGFPRRGATPFKIEEQQQCREDEPLNHNGASHSTFRPGGTVRGDTRHAHSAQSNGAASTTSRGTGCSG